MRYLLLFCLLLAACSSKRETVAPEPTPSSTCDGSTCPTPTVVPPTPLTQTVVFENMEVTMPFEWQLVPMDDAQTKVYSSKDEKSMLILIKEPYVATYEEYAFSAIRGLRAQGSDVKEAKQVEIDGVKFVLVAADLKKADGSSLELWMWITVQNGYGYSLACGGSSSVGNDEVCNTIASSFKIKQ
jgi:hypothetical protein